MSLTEHSLHPRFFLRAEYSFGAPEGSGFDQGVVFFSKMSISWFFVFSVILMVST